MCDNSDLNAGFCYAVGALFCFVEPVEGVLSCVLCGQWYAEPGQVIAESTIFNLLCGLILFATFFHTLRRFYVMDREALGGVSNDFALPVHVFFLQVSSTALPPLSSAPLCNVSMVWGLCGVIMSRRLQCGQCVGVCTKCSPLT